MFLLYQLIVVLIACYSSATCKFILFQIILFKNVILILEDKQKICNYIYIYIYINIYIYTYINIYIYFVILVDMWKIIETENEIKVPEKKGNFSIQHGTHLFWTKIIFTFYNKIRFFIIKLTTSNFI